MLTKLRPLILYMYFGNIMVESSAVRVHEQFLQSVSLWHTSMWSGLLKLDLW